MTGVNGLVLRIKMSLKECFKYKKIGYIIIFNCSCSYKYSTVTIISIAK